jgi:Cellulase (glycosyl hydrolase family 5)
MPSGARVYASSPTGHQLVAGVTYQVSTNSAVLGGSLSVGVQPTFWANFNRTNTTGGTAQLTCVPNTSTPPTTNLGTTNPGTTTLATTTTLAPTNSQYLKVNGVERFAYGLNNAWVGDRSGWDLAPNDVKTALGECPACQYAGYQSGIIDTMHADMAAWNMKVWRLWLFEEGEGINWDGNGNAAGIKPELLTNVQTILNQASAAGKQVYITFFSYNTGKYVETKGNKKDFFAASEATARNLMISNVVLPIVNQFKNNSAVFAFDLVNEANNNNQVPHQNGNSALGTNSLVSFVPAALTALQAPLSGTGKKVTASLQWYGCCSLETDAGNGSFDLVKPQIAKLVSEGIGFVDIHAYVKDASFPVRNVGVWGVNLPVLIGEVSIDDAEYQALPNAQFTGPVWNLTAGRTKEGLAMASLLPKLKDAGYAGALHWGYHRGNQLFFNQAYGNNNGYAQMEIRRQVLADGSFNIPLVNALSNFGQTLSP